MFKVNKLCILTLVTSVLFTSAFPNLVVKADSKENHDLEKIIPNGYLPPEDPLKDFVPPSINYLCEDKITRSGTINVNVTSPCDEQWRNNYPDNWMWQANRAIERADDALITRFGIDYTSVSQKYWSSNNTDPAALVSEAKSEWGLSGADMMIAFTGRNLGSTAGIVDDFYQPYALIADNGYDTNSETVQHETGHCYNLRHCSNNCVMTSSGFGYIDRFCSPHAAEWNNNKNRY